MTNASIEFFTNRVETNLMATRGASIAQKTVKDVTSKVLLSLLLIVVVAISTMILAYAIASSLASSMASEFNTVEASRHESATVFTTAIHSASTQFKSEQTQCLKMPAADRRSCVAKAKASELQTNARARAIYKASGPSAEKGTKNVQQRKLPQNLGFALFQPSRS